MFPAVLARVLIAVLVVGVAACTGDEDAAEPLTLQQRLPTAAQTSGYVQDPVEVGWTASTAAQASGRLHDALVKATPEDAKRALEGAGFVSAISETLFRPTKAGAPHERSRPHLFFLVVQFRSEDGADEAVEFLMDDARQPCPGTCADQISEFEVDGIPNPETVRRVATKERVATLGREGDVPHESYELGFSDGEFAYVLRAFGPPGSVTEEQLESLASELYDRVQGAPPADT